MSRKSKTPFAILGMLSFSPKSAYEIARSIERSTSHFWAESDGQLYPNLKRLTENGLIESTIDASSSQSKKKVYSLTQAGEEALIDWLHQTPTTFNVRNEFLLQLFLGHNISDAENADKIKAYRYELKQQARLYDDIEKRIKARSHKPKYLLLSLSYGQYCLASELKWCDDAIELLEKDQEL